MSIGAIDAFAQTVQFRRLPIDEVFDRYEDLDTDNDDTVGVEGVAQLLKGLFNAHLQDIAAFVLSFVDADGTGRADPGKVVCAISQFCSGSPADKARVFFSTFDADNGGTLDRLEFEEMMVALLTRGNQLTVQLINAYATNAAGGDFVELLEISAVAARKLANATFDEADADGSGEIDYQEFGEWAVKHEQFAKLLNGDVALFGAPLPPSLSRGAIQAFCQAVHFRRLVSCVLFVVATCVPHTCDLADRPRV